MSLSSISERFRLPAVVGLALAVATGLSGCVSVHVGQPIPVPLASVSSSPGPASTPWRGPLDVRATTWDFTGVMLTLDNAVIVGRQGTLLAIDLATLSVLWTIQTDWTYPVMGDETGVAVTNGDSITVYDPRTGTVIGQAPLAPRPADSTTPTPPVDGTTSPDSPFSNPTAPNTPPTVWESLYWAGEGLLLMGNATDNSICVRAMTMPGDCLWTAPNMWSSSADYVGTSWYVFGSGRWVNTATGVRQLADGQPAPFGADAGVTPAGSVYYVGQSPDRIVRFATPDQLQRGGVGLAQPWDVATDSGLSPAVLADVVDTDPTSPVYVAIVNHADAVNTVTAYSWASGQQLWQRDNLFEWNVLIGLSGGVYLGQCLDRTTLMLDAATGRELMRAVGLPLPDPSTAANADHVYVARDLLQVYDNTSGALEWSAPLPDQPTGNIGQFFITPTYLGFMSGSQKLWVVDL